MSRTLRFITLAFILTLCGSAFAASTDVAANIETQGLILTLAGIFLGGILVSLTPCVYPMIPITLSIIGARSATSTPVTGFARSLVFVLGIATIYTILGLIVAMSGGTVGFILQNKWFLICLSVLFILMGISMLGAFNLQLPPSVAAKLQGSGSKGGFFGAFLLGITTGVVASPCGSPVLVGILALAGAGGQPGLGAVMLFTYALGIGMLFLVLGTFPAFLGKVPKSGVWMEDIKKFLGLVLIIAAFYYLSLAMSKMLVMGAAIATLLVFAVMIFLMSKERRGSKGLLWAWRVAALSLVGVAAFIGFELVPYEMAVQQTAYGRKAVAEYKSNQLKLQGAGGLAAGETTATISALTAPPAEWLTDEAAAVALAKENNWPLIVDFGAEWCAACKELEHKTFVDPEVEKVLAGFVKVHIDCTDASDENEELQKKYNTQAFLSLPMVSFVNASGEHLPDLTLYEFEPAADFLKRLEQVK